MITCSPRPAVNKARFASGVAARAQIKAANRVMTQHGSPTATACSARSCKIRSKTLLWLAYPQRVSHYGPRVPLSSVICLHCYGDGHPFAAKMIGRDQICECARVYRAANRNRHRERSFAAVKRLLRRVLIKLQSPGQQQLLRVNLVIYFYRFRWHC